MVCDQGSKDKRVIDLIEFYKPSYFRKNSKNEGCGKSFNQLYLRSRGEIIVLMGNDIECAKGWLEVMCAYLKDVMHSGLCSIDWGHGSTPPVTEKYGIKARYLNSELNRCFGVTGMKRELIEKVGLFHEGYGPYGLEDSDLNERVNRMGFTSFYLPYTRSKHLCEDVGVDSEYRKAKDESLSKNVIIFNKRIAALNAMCYEPLPELEEPI